MERERGWSLETSLFAATIVPRMRCDLTGGGGDLRAAKPPAASSPTLVMSLSL